MEIIETGFAKASDFIISDVNIRKKNTTEGLEAMADSIQNFALMEGIDIDENNEVIDGGRRLRSVELVKKRCGKEVLIPYTKYRFDSEEEKLLFSLISNERRLATDPEDKGRAIIKLLNEGMTYEDLEKMTGTSNRALATYVGQVRAIDEVKETHPDVAEVAEKTEYRKKRVVMRIMKHPPYSEDPRKVNELWDKANDMTLKELEMLEKDIKSNIPVDTSFRSTRTVDRATHSQIVTHVKKQYYNKLAERCEAEGVDIAKVVLSLLYAWADYEIDVAIKDNL